MTGAAACEGAIAGIIFMTAVPSASEAAATPQTIKTRQLEIVDEKGDVTARIRSEDGRATVEFLSNGRALVQIGTEQGGAQFSVLMDAL